MDTNRLILFDFDGTLADSFGVTLRVGNRLAALHGYRRLSEAEAVALKNVGMREILRQSDIPLRRLPSWIREMKRELRHEIPNMKPHPGLTEALSSLRNAGNALGIVTSNAPENVKLFLENNGWAGWFSYLEAGSSLFGKSRLIRRILDRSGIPASRTVYVGDEERDVLAARKAGVPAIAVAWGYNNRAFLAQSNPDHLIDRPEELLDFSL